jgi:transcriptional regulator with XRE-family HTH domain
MFGNLTVKTVKENVGKMAKTLRNREGLTQEELAAKLSLSRITIQNLEAGKNPTIETLLIVLQYFDQLHSFNQYIETQIQNNDYPSLY